ncbi:MAG: hypothetical protein QM751_14130 [Paludibacteraceae bacterium]
MKRNIFYFILLSIGFNLTAAPFRADSIYSKWAIDSRMGDFRNKSKTEGFLTPSNPRNATWDYVSGLVAKSILKAWEQYESQHLERIFLCRRARFCRSPNNDPR